jgi:septal ring factor EnvC (AmiA/AmiB activator)
MGSNDAALTAADKPDAVQKALAAERQTAREARRRANELESQLAAFEARDSEAITTLIERLEETENVLADTLDRNRRLEVALRTHLPIELVDRLEGNTVGALEADADRLLALFR